MSVSFLNQPERPFPISMALVLLPWLATVLIMGGSFTAVVFLGYSFAIVAAGYALIYVALPAPVRDEAIQFAPAVGIVVLSAITAFWLRMGLSLRWTPEFWLALIVAGAAALTLGRRRWTKITINYAGILVTLSLLVCGIYFLPAARQDAVLRHDGGFNWMYVDTQWFYSMSASIKADGSPPTAPGSVTKELYYHFGPYAPAAAISSFTGLDLGDALVRVTHAASLWALLLSCLGLGTLLSLKATASRFGGVMAVAGLFFYGSLLSLFGNETNSSSHISGAILATIPGIEVLGQGGPFSHLMLGHSELHSLVAITAIIGLCLIASEIGSNLRWRSAALLMLPALTVPTNSVAALYCVGAAGVLLFWRHLKSMHSWFAIVYMLALFLLAWKLMGYTRAADSSVGIVNTHPGWQWWTLAVGFLIGLGFRIISFRWISFPLRDPLSVLVLSSVLGLLAFSLLLQFQYGQERYGLYFLQSLFSIFAFSRLGFGWWRQADRCCWVTQWLRIARDGLAIFVGWGVLIACASYLRHAHTGVRHFGLKIIVMLSVLAMLATASVMMKRSQYFSKFASTIISCALLLGFLAWITPWLNFGLGRMKMDVTVLPGEVQGLTRLHELSGPKDRFATNKHVLPGLVALRERSYAYAALSERPVLLEGYSYLEGYSSRPTPGITELSTLLRENDLMFSTTDPKILRQIASEYHVHWLVAQPGTDISIPKPLPPWLVAQKDCGSLKIYQIK
jgi:hypothetical protein